ncbi:Gfo/Idh/MocA family oxidoreductase [Paenibacillus polysaccharolyticus]|uniref:Gfo/Idh/MocA family protein n=1 Tax=Paenibacillus polysaccharolyticus TaxID=582692 RepID=UPI0030089AAB
MSKVLNVGIIGTGELAQVVHLPILKELPEKFKVTALCDVSSNSLKYNGEKFGISNLYSNVEDLVNNEDIDVVFVCNSNEYHADAAIAAANAGKHVLVEKPMVLSLSEAEAVIEAKNRNKVHVMVGYMRRYAPAFEAAVKEIGGLDQILYARVRDIIGPNDYFIRQSGAYPKKFNDFTEELNKELAEKSKKWISEVLGEGADETTVMVYYFLTALGSHDLSAMREALGMPESVSGFAINSGGFMNAIFNYPSFNVVYETGMNNVGKFDAHLEVYGKDKTVRVEFDTPYIQGLPIKLIVSETEEDLYKETVIRHTYKDPYTIELEALYNAIVHDQTIKTTPEDYRDDLIIFKMIIDSYKKQKQ